MTEGHIILNQSCSSCHFLIFLSVLWTAVSWICCLGWQNHFVVFPLCFYLIMAVWHFSPGGAPTAARVTFGSSLIKMGVPVVNSRSHRPSLMNQIWLRCGTAGVSNFSNSFVLSGSFLLIIWTFQHEVTLKLHIRYAKDDDFIMGTSPKEQSRSARNMLFITLSVEFVCAA